MNFLRTRWVLILVLIIFTVLKLPYLSYPYYWDECWPYLPAIRQMMLHGVSLMPDAVDSELSRGHPLFFHAIAALWMQLFGNSYLAMHSFALTISLLFLIAIYETSLRMFNIKVAILALLFIVSQEIFIVQSSFVLLEMLLAFLAFMSLYLYVREKYVLTTIFLTALFYTKESGIVLGAVLGLDALIVLLSKKGGNKQNVYRLLSVCIPCVLIGVFFLLQKHIRGWYIFPFYAGLVEHNWQSFWYKFRMCCVRDVFYENYKYLDFLLVLVISMIATFKQRKIGYLIFLFPAAIIYYYVDDLRAGRLLPGIPFFILFLFSVWSMLSVMRWLKYYENDTQKKYIELSVWFILVFLCFSATNYFSYRYLLTAMVPLIVFASFLITRSAMLSFNFLYFPIIAIILSVSIYSFMQNCAFADVDMGSYQAMKIQQSVVQYLESNHDQNKSISCGSFMGKVHLTDPNTGFLQSSVVFKNVQWNIDTATDIVIFDNIEPDARYESIKHSTSFHLVFRDSCEKDSIWSEIYERK